MAAPTKQPKAIAKLKGTYQKCRHDDEIQESKALDFVHKSIPYPPEGLNEIAKEVWTSTLSQAMNLYGYISFIDLKAFETYCTIYAEVKELGAAVRVQGLTVVDDKGMVVVNPLYPQLRESRNELLKYTREFGFTPSARTRIKLEQKPEQQKEVETFEL